jgi:hypothetical protein
MRHRRHRLSTRDRLSMRDRLRHRRRLVELGLKAKPVRPGKGQVTGPRPAGRAWTLTDDDMLRKLLTSGMKAPAML